MVRVKINLLSKLGVIAAILLLASCDNLFHQYCAVGGCWVSSDTLTFTYSAREGEERLLCNFDIEVRSNSDYRYKELFLRVERLSKLQRDTVVDTLLCELFDDKGYRKGSAAGILQQTGFTVDTLEVLPDDTLTIKISHLMDDECLQGVSDVGVRLSRCGRHQF